MLDLLRSSWRIGMAAVMAVGVSAEAGAHPHVFVKARAEILFDGRGRMTDVRNVWTFDPAFSAFATQGLDSNHDGRLSAEELAPLAKTNVNSLKVYAFFTFLTVGKQQIKFKFPDQYFLRRHDGRLTLFYQLPLANPIAPGAYTRLEIFDPEYFVAFTFAKQDPIILYQAPRGCAAQYKPPHPLDAGIMAKLAAVPVSQHDLPRALRDAAVGLAHVFTVTCLQ
jgi:ABC-type uncharacterized transport system substrate-binding protein